MNKSRFFACAYTTLILILCACSTAPETAPPGPEDKITQVFNAYTEATLANNFYAAARYIYSEDLIQFMDEILPTVLKMKDHSSQLLNAFAASITANAKDENGIHPELFFAAFMKAYLKTIPRLEDSLVSADITINSIEFIDEKSAILGYSLQMAGQLSNANEALIKSNDEWYIRLKQKPQDVRALLEELLN